MKLDLKDLLDFGITFGWIHSGVTSVSLLAREGDFGVSLGPLFVYNANFVATLGSLGSYLWHLKAALGAFWCRFGSTCGIWG